jgi:acyl dehydratase
MATKFEKPEEFLNAVGQHLGFSDWVSITQERIDKFAEATGDYQWIHTDPERAKAGPFGKTIAHGYLTQSMVGPLVSQIVEVHGVLMAINYGTDRVRFPAAVPVDSKVRAGAELIAAEVAKGGAIQTTIRVTVEIEGSDKPGAVVDTVSRFIPA